VSVTFNGGAGGMKILYATNGALVANIEQSAGVYYVGTGWDNVGNVYAGSAAGYWAEFSPPGANAATTPAVATVTVTAPPTPPHITSITSSGGTVTIRFTGGASDPSSAFTLLSSAVVGPLASYTPAAGATGLNGRLRLARLTFEAPASDRGRLFHTHHCWVSSDRSILIHSAAKP
jgi:hypothetical protein